MKRSKNIICVFWKGTFLGVDDEPRDYGPQDVERLFQNVSNHMDCDFDFWVLTNDLQSKFPGTVIPLLHPDLLQGWWAKMELFRSDLPINGKVLYLDLDSLIVRSLKPIFDCTGDMVLFPGRMSGKRVNKVVERYQSSMIYFEVGAFVRLYTMFMMNAEYYKKQYQSEQDLLGGWLPNQPVFPGEWLMKLSRVTRSGQPGINEIYKGKTIVLTGRPTNGLFRKTLQEEWLYQMMMH